eukprot:CAMPEP_0204219930 /NCGR_PEP_ID=MMETSP0361-20130328/80642_1 /ASSEMBLY_ACC=CAM_ASM_000343 /TAXON_ID=268821 /ORGANISM="Scrippsiella Hangoei, Strain SHTV-5" /LENGTH=111 /DNA_ID=CAMNT_0051185277 /DNA_START=180 /DNA_END=512 /DNA_ORIENTATION=+
MSSSKNPAQESAAPSLSPASQRISSMEDAAMCGNNGLVQAHRHKRENPGCGDQLPHHTTWSVEALRDELRGIDKAHSAARDICFTIFYSPSNEELVRRSIRSAQLGRPLKA